MRKLCDFSLPIWGKTVLDAFLGLSETSSDRVPTAYTKAILMDVDTY